MKTFYITTTLPYVNAEPHIGFALELVQADAIARSHRAHGERVIFNTGTDEHGLKIFRAARAEGVETQEYVDRLSKRFRDLTVALNISTTHFIRTTDPHHVSAAQEFWRRCDRNGDIYKKAYRIKYCVGCELEKTESEIVRGKCELHPNLALEELEEENYFFRFSKYQDALLKLYAERPDFVFPASRLNEVAAFVRGGLRDFSISRLTEKLPWGVPAPGDDSQVMYVWFDALVNYISTLGWPEDENTFRTFWPGVQIAGKDNLRQQAAMWQAMLLSAGLPPSRQILIHGFITSEGRKMSKSSGNVVDPFQVVEQYGADAARYYLLREISPFDDGDFSEAKFRDRYNGDLANGLGNFASRVLALAERAADRIHFSDPVEEEVTVAIERARTAVADHLDKFAFHEAFAALFELIGFGDRYVNERTVWAIKDPAAQAAAVWNLVVILDNVAKLLEPFLPASSKAIAERIKWSGDRLTVTKGEPLFPRRGA